MSENMMNSGHKSTNDNSRTGYDLTFGRPGKFDDCIACSVSVKNGGTGNCDCKLARQFNGK